MKSCSYGTTCRTPPTTTYSPEPREARRPTASPSALASRDIAEMHTPRARVCQGRERARHEPGWSVQGRWRWSVPRAGRTRELSDRCPTDRPKNAESTWKITPPPRRGDHRPRPPRSARRSRAGRLYVSITHKGKSHVARAPADAHATLAAARPPLSFFSRLVADRLRPPATPSETVAPRTPRARAGTSSPTGHARARSLLIGAGRRPRAAPSLKSSRGGSG